MALQWGREGWMRRAVWRRVAVALVAAGPAALLAGGLVFGWLGVAAGQGTQNGAQQAPAEAVAQARLVTRELSQGLQQMLGEELAKGGFAGAVKVCSEKAQTITGDFNAALGASARRVSTKYRNPNDQPDAYEAAMLARWQAAHARKALPQESVEVVRDPQGQRHLRYMKPILVQAMCLRCHGAPEAIPAEVKTLLGNRYPRDLATGYQAGDLRGAVSVRIPLNGD